VCQHLTVARVAEGLGVAWNTANDAVLAEGKRVLIDDPGRFDGVTVVGVDEHVVRHEALLFRMEVRDLEAHVEVEATWGIYQRMITAYREPDRVRGRELMQKLIESVSQSVPAALTELISLGRTLKKRAADVLAYFDRPGTSNGPHRGHQRSTRTPPRLCPRVPQPHQLHRQITAGDRRLQTPTTP